MTLNNDTGNLNSRVIDGSCHSFLLDDLDIDSLLKFLTEFEAHDTQSAALLEACLDRT
jgi:hypothetical protein|tara:strand:- start:1162 stop:1335 length:174 start_codon:yes stop_codon:yes gene_type:complete